MCLDVLIRAYISFFFFFFWWCGERHTGETATRVPPQWCRGGPRLVVGTHPEEMLLRTHARACSVGLRGRRSSLSGYAQAGGAPQYPLKPQC